MLPSMKPKKRKKLGVPDPEKFLTNRLMEAGWWLSDEGWRHKELHWPWPAQQAIRLQEEAEEGQHEAAHRMLRGEAT